MTLNATAAPAPGIADLPSWKVLRALDLTGDPAARPLWKNPGSTAARDASVPALARPGFISPMGFWLCAASDVNDTSERYTIRFESHGAPAPATEAPSFGLHLARRPEQVVRLKPPHIVDGELILKIGPNGVRIVTSESAWKALSEPVLLAIAQYWRFLAIDDELDRLTELARGDLDHATMPGIATLGARRRLTENARAARALLLDIPHFQGPLTDAFAYCSTELSAQAFLSLAEKLRLEEWCERIDERAEAVEDSFEVISEKLLEYKNFAWEAALEILIVAILCAELGLTLYEMFGPG